jgi:drug/metabolite transporter (DMT)-like permease
LSEIALRPALIEQRAATVRGIALIVLTYLLMTVADTAAKLALPVAGVALSMAVRGATGAANVALIARAQHGAAGWRRLLPVRWRLVALRAILAAGVSTSWYIAWLSISLVDSYAIGFLSPLIITLLAVPMLGERLLARRVAATLVGFAGVLIMLRPGGELWTPAVPLLLVGIVLMAISRVMTRQLATTETPECLAVSILVAHVPAGLLLLGLFPPTGALGATVCLALLVLGLCNGVAHTIMARAYALAPVSALAPFEYTTLIWGGVFGFLMFGDVPTATTVLGAAVVVAAGLHTLDRERSRGRALDR